MTPDFASKAAYGACAPLHCDAEEWDFWAWSEDDDSLTDGEDLQFLLDGELEDGDNDDDVFWDGHDSSSEEEEDDESTEEDSMVGSVIPRSEIEGTKPPYVCPGCFIHTCSNNMINRFHVQ
jgi:hypothetical protein